MGLRAVNTIYLHVEVKNYIRKQGEKRFLRKPGDIPVACKSLSSSSWERNWGQSNWEGRMCALKGSLAYGLKMLAEWWLWFFKNKEADVNTSSQAVLFPVETLERKAWVTLPATAAGNSWCLLENKDEAVWDAWFSFWPWNCWYFSLKSWNLCLDVVPYDMYICSSPRGMLCVYHWFRQSWIST